ncbi:repressor [Vibrio splendidus]|jgi:SOS-response transcriptional repressor LexA|uniref:Repressor n=2 Tax=Vibrio TaxID=662 RepID=A0A0P6Z638_VIBSP|nr:MULTISPECIES: LexA family transcriptional regulator [Vibrio]KPL99268.1 repressor [Vibrio splendidus]MBE8567683.1 LexA family transcriptional regulator [Vibrio sp. OPT20]OEF42261.1 repressor [Vibrio cyclitrophicus 1F289]PMJ62289.1 repressor [Vibrio splendidus]PMM74303.1 repressor [Vibrio lentus]
MSLAERVKQRRKLLGLSQASLAELVGVAQQSIFKIEGGVTTKPRNIISLAKALECDASWLLTGKGYSNPEQGFVNSENLVVPLLKRVPLISNVQAGNWKSVQLNLADEEFEWQFTPAKVSDDAFALRVTGNSMTNPFGSPSIPDGSIVIVEPCSAPDSGKIVVATLNDEPQATIKKLEIDGPNKFLIPLNPSYQPIPINGNCRIVGFVKQVIMDL